MNRRHATGLTLALVTVVALGIVAASVPQSRAGGDPGDADSEPRAANQSEDPPEPPPLIGASEGAAAVVALALIAMLGVVAASRALRGDDPPPETAPGVETTSEPDLGGVAEAAGRAARRIERRDPDAFGNEVYHAWRAMTVALGAAEDETRTPAEFARLAADAGMDREDVRELTDLFRDVRYGETDPTPALEDRATDLLRRIDRTYGNA